MVRTSKPSHLDGTRRIADGGLSDFTDVFEEVGSIPKSVAAKAGIKAGKIVVSKSAVEHITTRHSVELASLGMTPNEYVLFIAQNYNRIYSGSMSSLLLAVFNEDKRTAHTAVVRVNYSAENGFWEVVTAQPRAKGGLRPAALKWEKYGK